MEAKGSVTRQKSKDRIKLRLDRTNKLSQATNIERQITYFTDNAKIEEKQGGGSDQGQIEG